MGLRKPGAEFRLRVLAMVLLAVGTTAGAGFARQGAPPQSAGATTFLATDAIRAVALPAIDPGLLRTLAEANIEPGPLMVAEGVDVEIGLADGTWENVAGGRLWRLRIDSPGALHLNFGFGAIALPEGATLHVISLLDETFYVGPYTFADKPERGLWTPMVPGDGAVIELFLPHGSPQPLFELTRVGLGFVDLFKLDPTKHELNACHIDVICPQSFMDDEERSVARLLINNSGLCTGTLLNDVGDTRTPFILTADHCGITAGLAPTVVALFNFKSATCGGGAGPTTDTVSGSTLRATRTDVDGTLLQLNSSPPQSYSVFYAGWDRSNSTPSGTAGIHHPQGTSMAFCEDTNPPLTSNNCIGGGGVNSHWQPTWTLGTTLQGSSGSALFDRSSRRVIGHLSGGLAACNGSNPNGLWDCYGKLAVFWNGASASERLRDWLDPGDTGTMTVDGLDGTPPPCTPDAFEPDDASGQATTITSGVPKSHSICPVGDVDWSVFTLSGSSQVVLETSGPAGDTLMWLRDAGLSLIEFDDDGGAGLFSFIDRICGVNALASGTYYVQVEEFGGNDEIASYQLNLTVLSCTCPTEVTLADQTLSGTEEYQATTRITLGPRLTADGTGVLVEAPTIRVLNDTVLGGTFTAGNNPPCAPPPP